MQSNDAAVPHLISATTELEPTIVSLARLLETSMKTSYDKKWDKTVAKRDGETLLKPGQSRLIRDG